VQEHVAVMVGLGSVHPQAVKDVLRIITNSYAIAPGQQCSWFDDVFIYLGFVHESLSTVVRLGDAPRFITEMRILLMHRKPTDRGSGLRGAARAELPPSGVRLWCAWATKCMPTMHRKHVPRSWIPAFQ
jgi:hypothetical protein